MTFKRYFSIPKITIRFSRDNFNNKVHTYTKNHILNLKFYKTQPITRREITMMNNMYTASTTWHALFYCIY